MSAETHHSQDWYRIAAARPRLRPGVTVARHLYLGRPWYMLAERGGTRAHRLTAAAWAFAGRLDGQRSVEEIWQALSLELAEDAPTQDELVSLLAQLHQGDLLDGEAEPLLHDLLQRRDRDRGQIWKKLFLNPLSMTLPLVDPDRFLARLARLLAPLPPVLWWGAALALGAVALALLPFHWQALAGRGLEGFLDLENLVLIALIYPAVKALHELAHGLATRARGGEVHEMGLMFIVFFPIPYVEASSSLVFPSKWDRAAVAGAGVAAEMAIAALAFLLWTAAEPGVLRTVLFNTMAISGFSTLAVNGNPLLKFDGYHVLCDLVEIPNLAKRGNEWWGEMLRVHLLGTRERRRARMPVTGWERLWFALYPPAAFVYRLAITLTISVFVASTYRLAGVLLGLWSLALSLVWPAAKTAKAALTDGRIRRAGGRAVAGAVLAAGALAALLLVPLPHRVVVQGVTWLPEEAFLRAPQPGRVAAVAAGHGAMLRQGAPIMTIDAPELLAERAVAAARLARAEAVLARALAGDRRGAAQAEATRAAAGRQLAEADRRLAELRIAAPIDGRLELPGRVTPVGQFRDRGALLGHVLPDRPPVIRVAVPQELIELVRSEARGVGFRLADDTGRVHPARILRLVPAGADSLPSPALALEGGGPFATAPGPDGQPRPVRRLFQIDLMPEEDIRPAWGMRAFVRIEFAPKPLATRLVRALREAFLDVFGV